VLYLPLQLIARILNYFTLHFIYSWHQNTRDQVCCYYKNGGAEMTTLQKQEVTKERIAEIIGQGKVKSLTDISRALGYKGSSGGLSKKIRRLVPHIEKLIKMNQVVQELTVPGIMPSKRSMLWKSPAKVTDKKNANDIPAIYRPSSNYQKIFSILYKHQGDKGITRQELLKKAIALTKRPEKLCGFDISVVTSCSQDGTSHKSANRAANSYWVEKGCGGFLRLHMR